jgi:flagellar hook-associated protein 2
VKLTATTKLSQLAGVTFDQDASGNEISKTLTINGEDMEITSETTISDVLTKLKNAGLNASYDEKQQRLFVSAKESGADGQIEITSGDTDFLSALGLKITKQIDESGESEQNGGGVGATYTVGQDALITLNGAEFESSNNVFEINGLTFTALSKTAAGETVTVTTQQDTDGIYDLIKNFIKEYDTVINELDKLYNADSADDYEPLTDDEKESMSDSEVEKYEQKIKDALLRRDSSVSSISSALKTTMMKGVEVNGKTMYLTNFGIETLSYFTAADNEKNAYHIDGDADDSDTSGNADKLKSMIASDPDTVISFFTQLSQNLYTEMSNNSKSIEGYRSFGSFYDDKKMKSDYSDYTSKISDLEDELADYEDKWYEKFASMETALAKLQSSASAVTGLLGGS